jgi:hypothetical protein
LFQALKVEPPGQTEEEFWAEHDPFGDRFSKRVPWWAGMAVAIALALAIYFLVVR